MYVMIIYIYLLICLLILFYTIGYVLFQSYNEQRYDKDVEIYRKMIVNSLQWIKQNGYLKRKYNGLLFEKIKKTNQLIAFDNALGQLEQDHVQVEEYLIQIEPSVIHLVKHYKRKSKMEQAYLAWFIANRSKGTWLDPTIIESFLSYLNEANVYLRENILMVTYQQPNVQWIIKAFEILTENNLYHNPKLIEKGLLNHPYDRELLAKKLWEQHLSFNPSIVQGIIEFITYQSDQFKESFYTKLKMESIDLEMKTRLMRYFKKYHYQKVEPLLIQLTSDPQDTIRIVAVHVLGTYESEHVIAMLKNALTDANWYVRRNASLSLIEMNISKEEITDVLTGYDLYAKEMITYHLQKEGVSS